MDIKEKKYVATGGAVVCPYCTKGCKGSVFDVLGIINYGQCKEVDQRKGVISDVPK